MEQIKKNIADLVEKYNRLKKENKIKDYNEAQTLSGFIEPLFITLGWDVHNLEEVTPEENISGDRADRAFRINGIVKFFLEAKSMKADLDVESYARQAIKYSWNKGVNYAVLTDFEGIKVFNANAKSKSLRDKIIFQISCENYISDFEKLWLLSKESFEKNKLDEYAESIFKKSQKLTVNEKLYDDLKESRTILTNSFRNWNGKLDQEDLDEGVQRILDRLVFIRVLEDRKLEDLILRPLIREEKNNQEIFHSLIGKFRELDDIYNSNLFHEHSCENWENYDMGEFKKVIELLYGNDVYEYDFKEIPADILGGVYESYLGYIAQNPINVGYKKGKLFDLDNKNEIKIKSRQKRKEHGIYYTPKFIVDYIVKNTLGEKLKEIESMNDLKKIKVLDPACGSGSFLTRALEEMNNKYKDFGNPGKQETKTEIILSNIYGVDLDAQATELAKLNLLLDTLDKKAKLPSIKNVRVGNSLISGNETELKKYFGKNWQDKKPFNWEEEFPEVFKEGGFDVIIGNPPYVVLDSNVEELPLFKDEYKSSQGGKANLYKLFIEKAINMLKDGGYLGFICPSNYISSADSLELRKIILENTNMIEIIEYSEKEKVFANVTQSLTTIILKKGKKISKKLHIKTIEQGDNIIDQKEFQKNKELEFIFENKIISKMNENENKLFDYADCYQGEINVSTKKDLFTENETECSLGLLRGNMISHYKLLNKPNEYCPLIADKRKHWENQRVVFQEVSNRQQKRRIKATFVEKNVLCGHTTNYCFSKIFHKKNNLFILALLNSNLINYYFSYFNKTNHVPVGEIRNIPLPKISKERLAEISILADKMLELNKQLQIIYENSDKWNSIKKEIEKTDKEIDRKIYELYGLTGEEIKIVEK